MKNNQIVGIIVGLGILLASLFLFIFPFVADMDMMDWGYAMICFSGFLFVAGTITFFMFTYRAIRLHHILNGKNILAHWKYPASEYEEEAKKKLESEKARNKILISIVWFFFVVITLGFIGLAILEGEEDSLGLFVAIMGGVLFVVTSFSLFMPHVHYKLALHNSSEALISKDGLFFMGQLHTWNKPFFILKNVHLDEKIKNLVFEIKYFTKLGWYKYEDYEVAVPIPNGEIVSAKNVVKALEDKKLE